MVKLKNKNPLKNVDISNSIKMSFTYCQKKEYTLIMTIKKVFEEQINDIIELKDEKMEARCDGNIIIYKKKKSFICITYKWN